MPVTVLGGKRWKESALKCSTAAILWSQWDTGSEGRPTEQDSLSAILEGFMKCCPGLQSIVGIFAQASKAGRRLVLPSGSPAVVLNGHTGSWEATAQAELGNQSCKPTTGICSQCPVSQQPSLPSAACLVSRVRGRKLCSVLVEVWGNDHLVPALQLAQWPLYLRFSLYCPFPSTSPQAGTFITLAFISHALCTMSVVQLSAI